MNRLPDYHASLFWFVSMSISPLLMLKIVDFFNIYHLLFHRIASRYPITMHCTKSLDVFLILYAGILLLHLLAMSMVIT